MRNQQLINLGEGRVVTLNELRVKDARKVMQQAKLLEAQDVASLLGERFDEVAALLGDCVVMPKGESLDELSFSEISQVKDGFLEVNQAFLDLLGLAALLPPTPPETSTAPASS